MPGTFVTLYVLAFDLDERDQPVRAFGPRRAATKEAALEEARELAVTHAGVVV
ncbi:hypothetical protein [Rhizobium sp. BK418]|uniref:hypothetical protein n=1 Tax=Rhizobium sp. BK418 TaxID=2512120 RepID=UPI001FDF8517|nr:hypothetical protein [Rhizobium sp. BK418]